MTNARVRRRQQSEPVIAAGFSAIDPRLRAERDEQTRWAIAGYL